MEIELHEGAPALASSAAYRRFVAVDLLLQLGVAAYAAAQWLGGSWSQDPLVAPVVLALALAGAATAIGTLGLRAGALVWRRRVALLAVIGALLRGTPLADPWLQAAVVLWSALVWIATLLEGRRVTQVVVEAEAPARRRYD